MTIFQAVILGIVEGLTEFLPISSTAHLILMSQLLNIPVTEFTKLFEVVIQSGAILAVVILYIRLVLNNRLLLSQIIVSFIPTAIAGFVLHDTIKNVFFESNMLIAIALFMGSLVFLVIEYMIKKKHVILSEELQKMTYSQAFFIGLIQAFSVVPGVSRAGAVIVIMVLLKYKRTDAAIYSFLLAIPTIFAASVFDLIKTDLSLFSHGSSVLIITVGFLSAFLSAFFVVRWFIQFLQSKTLIPFALYRIMLAVLIILVFAV